MYNKEGLEFFTQYKLGGFKMAKKKIAASQITLLGIISLLLGIVVVIFLSADAISYKIPIFNTVVSIKGSAVAFGNDSSDANMIALFGYFLPMVGGILTFLGVYFSPKRSVLVLVGAGLTLLGIVFLFMIPREFKLTAGPLNTTPDMAVGLVFAIILSCLSLASNVLLMAKGNFFK